MADLSQISGVVSVYTYKLPYGEIPLLIVDDEIKWEELKSGYQRTQGCIILTLSDIHDGRDVFALRFLHMKEYASLVAGYNYLIEIKIKKDNVRNELETTLRSLLVDLREGLLMGEQQSISHKSIALQLDRITVGVAHFGKKHHKKHEQRLHDLSERALQGPFTLEELEDLYHHLVLLTQKVDEE